MLLNVVWLHDMRWDLKMHTWHVSHNIKTLCLVQCATKTARTIRGTNIRPLGVSGIVRHEATGSSIIHMLDQIGILRGWRPWHCPAGGCRCLHMVLLFTWVVSATYQDRDYCYLLYLQGVFNVVAGSCILLFEQYTFVWKVSHDTVIICIHDMHDSMQTHIV